MNQRELVDYVKVQPSHFVLYRKTEGGRRLPPSDKEALSEESESRSKSNENLLNNDTCGLISSKAARKIRYKVDWMLECSHDKRVFSKSHQKKFTFRLNFVTLTLASRQIHSDKHIKEQCLNQFLIEAKRRWNVHRYLWRAEAQKNGNIHFHVLTDQFIPWSELRDVWNRIQNKLGYVDRYRDEMRRFFNGGFRVRQELLHSWSYKRQLSAYKHGCKHDWNAPNSTDVHSLLKVKNIAAYISKYCSKNGKGRKVEGRLWGLSESLSKLVGAVDVVDNELFDELNMLHAAFSDKFLESDYYSVVLVRPVSLNPAIYPRLFRLFQEYVMQHREQSGQQFILID